jgi:Recombinase
VVRRIQRQRARGESERAIAESLNQDKVPTAQGGKQWYGATLRGVLLRTSLARDPTASHAALPREHLWMAGACSWKLLPTQEVQVVARNPRP